MQQRCGHFYGNVTYNLFKNCTFLLSTLVEY